MAPRILTQRGIEPEIRAPNHRIPSTPLPLRQSHNLEKKLWFLQNKIIGFTKNFPLKELALWILVFSFGTMALPCILNSSQLSDAQPEEH